jgi:antitoxin component YwqK of YwqJK toxin-antitoxin module
MGPRLDLEIPLMRCSPFAPAALALAGITACGLAATTVAQEAKQETDVKAVLLDEPEPTPRPTVVTRGKREEKYPGGAVRVQREVVLMSDDQVINHGKYTEFYSNGKKFAEGNYVNGVHDGEWSFWHENGELAKTVTFKNGRAEGTWESHRDDGSLFAKKTYKDNLREGTWIIYYDDGKTPKVEQTYVASKLDGPRKTYFENGKLWQEAEYKDGKLEGKVIEWNDKGDKVAEATFSGDKLNGTLTRWSSDGKKTVQTFKDNKLLSQTFDQSNGGGQP